MVIPPGLRHILLILLLCVLFPLLSCLKAPSSKGTAPGPDAPAESAVPEPSASAGAPSAYGLDPLAILEPGDLPLWFELGAGGPLLVNAPGAASLTPFTPWPLARFVRAVLIREDTLFLAVNRDGFLILTPGRTGETADARNSLTLYRAADPSLWGQYTIASAFLFRALPSVLFYRDDFFTDPAPEAPSPRVLAMVPGTPYPSGLEIPAFAAFPPQAGWDIDNLRLGQDGFWYYRSVRKLSPPGIEVPAPRYFRGADLSLPGEEISLAAFQESARPEFPAEAPPLLRLVLENAFKLNGPDRLQTAAVFFPGSSGLRYFAPQAVLAGEDAGFTEFSGYYRDAGSGGFPDALVVRGDGRGIYGKDRGAGLETGSFFLPPLQEGFVYTGVVPLGTVLIASWEEQQGFSVGAAGFMVINAGGFNQEDPVNPGPG
jgi:hypothetical protein